MRQNPPITLALAALCIASSVILTPAHAAAANPLDQAFEQAKIEAITDCQHLSSAQALRERYKYWKQHIAKLAKAYPEHVNAWIIGAQPPPKLIAQETLAMRDCMLAQMVTDAAKPDSKLVLDLGEPPTKKTMRNLAKKLERSPAERTRIGRMVTSSFHRDADSQAFIWHRKFLFTHPRNFNLISADAAKKCGFTPGNSWRPQTSSHRRCWLEHLNAKERQREILTASSAPGISRHHWGTELDLFNLNPRKYEKHGPYADEYAWMQDYAVRFGFFQPFTGNDKLGQHTYIEERWHWSYYPIAQGLLDYIQANPKNVERAMFSQWDSYERRWSKGKTDFFGYVREHWMAYVTNTAKIEHATLFTPWLAAPQCLLAMHTPD